MSKPQRTSTYAQKKSRIRAGKRRGIPSQTSVRWWNPSILDNGSDRRANAVANDCHKVRNNQEYRESLQILHAALYGNAGIMCGFGPNSYAKVSAESTQRLALNVVQNNCNAAKSKITKNRPKATFLTDGGDYALRRKAESLEKYMDGVFYDMKAYDRGTMAFLHATIWGRGILKTSIEWGKIVCDNVFPWELVIDDAEAQHPERLKTIIQRKHVDRWTMAKWAESMEEEHGLPEGSSKGDGPLFDRVMACTSGPGEARDVDIKATADNIVLYEAWHLPSTPDGDDGRHTVCTHEFCIIDEPWEHNRFPFSTVAWQDAPMGWHATGLAEILTGLQVEINTLLGQIQEGHHLITGQWLVQAGSEVIANHLNNDLARIVEFAGGTPPVYVPPSIISPEIYEHLKWLYQLSSEICAISSLFASAQKPAGLNSGKALLTFDDFQTERFADQAKNYENLFLDLADWTIELSKVLAKQKKGFGIRAIDKRQLRFIKWADVDMKRDEFVMKVFPTSMLASQPAAKLQQVQEMTNAGWLEKDVALDLVDFPDTEQYTRRLNGWRRCVEADLANIADEGVYSGPEPTYDLTGPIMGGKTGALVRDALNDYKSRGLEESDPDRMEMMRQYMQAVIELWKQAQSPPPPPPVPGAPGAPGGPPPPMPGGPLATAKNMAPPLVNAQAA